MECSHNQSNQLNNTSFLTHSIPFRFFLFLFVSFCFLFVSFVSKNMFTLRFGKNEARLFNANCSVTVLLDALRTSTGNVEFETVDLADSDMVLVDLREHSAVPERASTYLKEGGVYTLVAVVVRGGEDEVDSQALDEEFVVLFEDSEGNVPEIQKSPPPVAAGKKGAPPAGKKK
eukprot:TRINITY_DN1693_c1_g1_i1.p1 TRINITY_DN1693_c1_g1~~TRINITY_DN1693_c1_g1_i1.p1  ORF type:complete len:174 (+),score=52.87 TRINITY_DN1693_c1_g1_i1:195-716(+)